MNLTITLNNNEILTKSMEGKELNDRQEFAFNVIKDDYACLIRMNDLIKEKDETIAEQFKHSAVLAIESKQLGLKILSLEKEILTLKSEIEEIARKFNNAVKEI